jgi:hypothetical protein
VFRRRARGHLSPTTPFLPDAHTEQGTFCVPHTPPFPKYLGNNFRSFRILLPSITPIGDLFPWRQSSGAVKIDPIGKIALREKFIAGKGITLQIFHSAPM